MSRKITGIGETVLDIVFKDDQPKAAIPGGSTFNAMISLGRTAARDFPQTEVSMVTETGDDHVGDIVTSFMEANGVGTDAVTRNKGTQTHISLAFLDDGNNAQYQFYKDHASASLIEDKVSGISFCKDDLVLFGSYFAINPKIRNYTSALLHKAHDTGAILYYDINFRKSHLKDLADTYDNIVENCSLSDIVRGSDEDFGYLFGTTDPEEVYCKHISPLCPLFICTCGPEPIHIFTPSLHLTIPVPQVETVSTIGAGDNFNAGLLYSLLAKGLGKDRLCDIQAEEWKDIVDIADSFSIEVCRSMDNYVDRDFVPGLELRNAAPEDAPLIAQCLSAAVGMYDFQGDPDDDGKKSLAVLEELARMEDSLYSYRNTVVVSVCGKEAGCFVTYPGDIYEKGRKKTWALFKERMGGNGSATSAVSDPETGPGEYYFDSAALLPQFRGNGILKYLMKLGLKKAKSLGYERVTLIVLKEHPKLVSYYASIGFEPESELKFMGETYIKMACRP